jgi:hypothetical protein
VQIRRLHGHQEANGEVHGRRIPRRVRQVMP